MDTNPEKCHLGLMLGFRDHRLHNCSSPFMRNTTITAMVNTSGKPKGHGYSIRVLAGPIIRSLYRIPCPPLTWPPLSIILTVASIGLKNYLYHFDV